MRSGKGGTGTTEKRWAPDGRGAGGRPAPLRPGVAGWGAALRVRRHETLFTRVESALGQRFSRGLGGSGSSNRARRARDLFTEHAGRTKIEGAEADRFGNAA